MSDYEPSPELVAWCLDSPDPFDPEPVRHALTAAVAYRTPDGHPELVPWEQVRELVDAAREAEPWLDYLDTNHAPDWAPHEATILTRDLTRLRDALTPFTQEPHDGQA